MTSQVGSYTRIQQLAGGIVEDHLAQVSGPRGVEKTLVLQCLRSDMAEDVEFAEMFLDIARNAAMLDHPRFVRVFDVGVADGTYYLAREHVEGPSLSRLLKHLAAQRLLLPPVLCARIIAQVCEGLAFAHDLADPETNEPLRLVHHCVRPYNILLSHQGAAMMVDFGIDQLRSRWTPRLIPLLHEDVYKAPDVMRRTPVDRRVDVYSLGVVLYELLTLRRPFEATSDRDVMWAVLNEPMVPAERHRPDLPDALRSILARALAKERDLRYPDCHAFKADLEKFIRSTGESVTPRHMAQLVQQVLASEGAASSVAPRPDDGSSAVMPRQMSLADLSDPRSSSSEATSSDATRDTRPRWILAAAVGLGVLLGGGVLCWKLATATEPQESAAPAPR